jgi:peptide/nickel transport system substrate-binding protein
LELRVSLAGGVAVEADGVVIGEDRFPGRQGRLLFAYLVLEQARPVPRDELAEALWGEAPPATWDKALTVLASKLRTLLTEVHRGGAITLTGAFGCYRLDLPEGAWVDVLAAANALREAEAVLAAAGDLESAKAAAMRAASVARRPFLPGEEGSWVEEKRRELTDVRSRALRCLADASLGLGNASAAAKWAEEAIALEPFRETGYRRLMEAHAAAGNRAEALRVYERCRRLLADELGAYPSPETEAIYRGLLEAPSTEARATALKRAVVSVPESEPEHAARAPLSRRRRRQGALAIGTVLLLAAGITVSVIGFTGRRPTLTSAAANSAALIDAKTNRLVANVPVGNGPTTVDADEGAVWVADAQDDAVVRIDPRTVSVVDRIPVGNAPSGIAVGAGAVWVANSLDGTVSRIDPTTNDVVQPIPVGVAPSAVAVGAGAVWVTSADERSVTKIDAVSGHVVYTKPTGALGRGIAVGGGAVWVTDESSGRVVRIDPRSGSIVRTVNVGNGPTGISFGAGSVWVANSLDGTVSRIDPATNTVTAMIPLGEGPYGIAAGADAVWVSVEFSQAIVRIDPAKNRVAERIPIVNRPKGLAISGDRIWLAVQAAGVGHRGGRLVVANPSAPFETIDPAFGGAKALSAVYDSLLDVARRGGSEGTRVVPDLAVSLPLVTAGGTSYAFQLRRGIRYSDGTLVKASDFRRAFERLFRGRRGIAVNFRSLVGAEACGKRPRSCDLRRGIRTNDAAGTVVFHLRRPDGEFQFFLEAMPPAPPGTPERDVGTRPAASTGPYMIESYAPGRELKLVRNPYFRVWSQAATPDGFPDEIVFRLRLKGEGAVTAVERGRVDVSLGVPVDRLEEVGTRFASQLHSNPAPGTMFFLFLNTRLRPFNDIKVRRAINYAIDRAAVARTQGGPELAKPLCQFRPPSVAGYQPYCPYTLDRNRTGEWKAPDLARARRLVAASGTRGMKVTLWTFPLLEKTARELVATLERLGYRTSLRRVTFGSYFTTVLDASTKAQAGMFGWIGASGEPPSYVLPLLTCSSIRPGPQNQNPSFFCNRRIDAEIRRALRIQGTDADAAAPLWVKIERELVDQAPWVPLYTPQFVDFVSKRAGNYQYNPASALLLDQLWVR